MAASSKGIGSTTNGEPVQVIVRIRPEPTGPNSAPVVVARGERSVALLPPPAPPPDPTGKAKPVTETKTFSFDKVFHPQATQAALYEIARPLVLSAVDGYNSTIFAYGHTGSGKTHTMMGTPTQPGVTPRAVQEMFDLIRRMAAREQDTIFIVRMSYVELYNNQFRNLLDWGHNGDEFGNAVGFGSSVGSGRGSWVGGDSTAEGSLRSSWQSLNGTLASAVNGGGGLASRSYDGSLASLAVANKGSNRTAVAARSGKIEVRECPEAGVFLSGPGLRLAVTSAEEALRLVARGDAVRATAATDCNEHSSRSHSILSFHVESQRVNIGGGRGKGVEGGGVRLGKLHLVDLAGSERLSLSGSEGKRLNETQNINLSLSSLGDVLACLSRNATIIARSSASKAGGVGDGPGETASPVPYRNSKLTHFLKDSLGGNSKTLMVTTLRSTAAYHRQSLISLLYASRAKKIRNQSCVNVDTAGQSNLHQVSAEIETLKNRLQQRSAELNHLSTSHEDGLAENAALRDRLQGLSAANERERAQLEGKLSTVIHSQAGKLAVQHQAFVTLQARLQRQLGEYQKKCMMQQEEISHLKSTIQSLERHSVDKIGGEEVAEMQRVIAAWQTQATEAQEELRLALKELEGLGREKVGHKITVDQLASELKAAEGREKVLLGYWRQLQGVLSLGTASPMPAEGVIRAVHRLREERKQEANARVEAERARAGVERAARALAGDAGDCQDLERRVADLIREKEIKKSTILDLEAENAAATERLNQLASNRASTDASIAQEEAKSKAAAQRLSKAEIERGRALEMEGLRAALDDATAGGDTARAEAARLRWETQELVASRDEALRSNEAMRVKLQEFEGNLRGVSEETLVILEKKEADLRKVEEEKREEKESHDRETQKLHLSLEKSRAKSTRLEAEIIRVTAAVATEKENSATAATAAAGAAVAESAARARVAVAIGARQDAEKRASEAGDKIREMQLTMANEREAAARKLHQAEQACAELETRLRVAEQDARGEVTRGRAQLEELIQQKDEMTKRLLRQRKEKHDSELATERKRAQQVLQEALAAAERDIRRETERNTTAAVAALSRERDEERRRELDAKDAEMRRVLAEATVAAQAQAKAAELRGAEIERARAERERAAAEARATELAERLSAAKLSEEFSTAKLSEQMSTAAELSAEKVRAAELVAEDCRRALEVAQAKISEVERQSARALGQAEDRLVTAKREIENEHRRLLQEATEVAEKARSDRHAAVAERDAAMAEVSRERRRAEERQEGHQREFQQLQEAFSRRQEESAAESRDEMAAAVADAKRAAEAETAEEIRSLAARELSEALAEQEEESRRTVETAIRQKDREMAKALKAAARVAAKNQQEDVAVVEAEKQKVVTDLERKLQQSEEKARQLHVTHDVQACELGGLRAEVRRITREMEEKERRQVLILKNEITRAEEAEASAHDAASQLSTLEEEAERLRERLETVPVELRAEYERAMDEREKQVSEAVRVEAKREADALAEQAKAVEVEEREAALAVQSKSLAASHEMALREAVRNAVGATAAEKDALLSETRDAVSSLEGRLRVAEAGLEEARRQGSTARAEATEALQAQMLAHEESLSEAEARAAAALAAVESANREKVAELEAVIRESDERHQRELQEKMMLFEVQKRDVVDAAAIEKNEAVAALEARFVREAGEVAEKHRRELDRLASAFADERRAAVAEALGGAEKERERAVTAARVALLEEFRAEREGIEKERNEERTRMEEQEARSARRHAQEVSGAVERAVEAQRGEWERQARVEREALEARNTQQARDAQAMLEEAVRNERDTARLHAEDKAAAAAKKAIEAERSKQAKRLEEALTESEAAAELAVREATARMAKRGDDKVAAVQRRVDEEREKRYALEVALERAAKEWELERANALKAQQRAHQQSLESSLKSLAAQKDQALQAAVDAERRRAASEIRFATEKSIAESESVKKSALASAKAAEDAARLTEERAEEKRRQAERDVGREVEGARLALEEVQRVREEAEMAMEEGRAQAFKETKQLRNHSAMLLDTLRRTQAALTEESQLAKKSVAEAERLRREGIALAQEAAELREQAAAREERHREEMALARTAAFGARKLDLEQEKLDVDEAVQEERETLEREFHERLRVILEDKERQHTEVLSAALARSEAALGEVARVKQAMWAKAEENATTLTQAFEAAAARAAEEAELVTAEALAAQRAEHSRTLEVALAERDAEALEALRLLHEQHTNSRNFPGTRASPKRRSASIRQRDRLTGQTSNNSAVSSPTYDSLFLTRSASSEKRYSGKRSPSRRERRRPRPVSLEASPGEEVRAKPSLPLRRPPSAAAEGEVGSYTGVEGGEEAEKMRARLKTASASIAAAAAARDEALEGARKESTRLEEVLSSSPGGSREQSECSQSLNTAAFATARPTRAPAWTVEGPPWSAAQSVADDAPKPNDQARGGRESADKRNGGNESAESRTGVDGNVLTARVSNNGTAVGNGLTAREERYKRELEGLRTRVRELEGMMESRLEEREGMYRRKLRAAVAEYRTVKVREQGAGRITRSADSSVGSGSYEGRHLSRSDLSQTRGAGPPVGPPRLP